MASADKQERAVEELRERLRDVEARAVEEALRRAEAETRLQAEVQRLQTLISSLQKEQAAAPPGTAQVILPTVCFSGVRV